MKISFADLSSVILPILSCKFPVLLRGKHGIGKSEFVAQLAKHLGYPMLDKRASQMTEGDLIGLPVISGQTTSWNPPDWFKEACDKPVVLFLDELDRATSEVRQGFFELADSRKINGHKLHPDSIVISAINASDAYQVNVMDPAEINRWSVFDLDVNNNLLFSFLSGKESTFHFSSIPSNEDIQTSLKGDWRIEPLVLEFIKEFPQYIHHTGDYEDNVVYPTPRSWHRFGMTLAVFLESSKENDVTNDRVRHLAYSFLGEEAADRFTSYYSQFRGLRGTLSSLSFDEVKDMLRLHPGEHFLIFFLQKSFRQIKASKPAKTDSTFCDNCVKLFGMIVSREIKSLLVANLLSTQRKDIIKTIFDNSPEISEFMKSYALESKSKYVDLDKFLNTK